MEDSCVVLEVQSTTNNRTTSLAEDLSANFFASTWAKELVLIAPIWGFKLTVFSVTHSQNACMEQKMLPVSPEFSCVECIVSRLLTVCPLL